MQIYKNLNTLSINIFSVFIWKIFLSGFGSVRERECGSGSTVIVRVFLLLQLVPERHEYPPLQTICYCFSFTNSGRPWLAHQIKMFLLEKEIIASCLVSSYIFPFNCLFLTTTHCIMSSLPFLMLPVSTSWGSGSMTRIRIRPMVFTENYQQKIK